MEREVIADFGKIDRDKAVNLINASIDEKNGKIVIRGLLTTNSLRRIKTPDYQREVMKNRVWWDLVNSFLSFNRNYSHKRILIPDITLSLRDTDNFTIQSEDGVVSLPMDSVYVIDGLQRLSAAIAAHNLWMEGETEPFVSDIGCIIYINMDIESERELFKTLNINRTLVSSDVLLRESRYTHPSAQAIWNWTQIQNSTPIAGKVCWQQKMSAKLHLLKANSVFRTANVLMSRFGGRSNATKIQDILKCADEQLEAVGGEQFYILNIERFYAAISKAFRLTDPEQRTPNSLHLLPHLAFAHTVATHKDFWKNTRWLEIPPNIVSRLSTFRFTDNAIKSLVGDTKTSSVMLVAQIMKEHLNRGLKTNRLTIG